MRFSLWGVRLAILAALVLSPAPSPAHEGHDHGDQPKAPVTDAAPRGEASSDAFELVAIARAGELEIWLDRFATNAPVTGVSIEVETPKGPVKAQETEGGSYRLSAPFLAQPGRAELLVTVSAGGAAEILTLPLDIPAQGGRAEAAQAGNAAADKQRSFIGGNGAALAGAGGFVLGLVAAGLSFRRRKSVPHALAVLAVIGASAASAHEGHDHAEPGARLSTTQPSGERAQRLADGSLFAPKPVQRIFALRTILSKSATHMRSVELPGRIIPDPNASGYVQSAVGGRLSPPAGGFPRLGTSVKQGDILAYVTPPLQAIDVSDMRQRQGEIEQQINIVARRLARFEQLAPSGAVARSQLEDTKFELEGLKIRKDSLEQTRREPEALIAPVDGVIADGNPVAGQIVASSAIVFHIIDPNCLWVEALSFQAIASASAASASTGNGKSLSLSYRGSGFADRSQSIPVHFAIEGDMAGLRAGQFVTVLVTTGEEAKGIAVPRASLVRSANGQELVYEHVAAERFEPRAVRTEPLDGERVLIAAGVDAGKRIVTQGAELLDHVR